MSNAFIDLLHTAQLNRWCVTPFCTTCGAHTYRAELRKLAFDPPGPLFRLLSQTTEAELEQFPDWQDALWIAFMDLPLGMLQVTEVLTAWSKRPPEDIRLTDFVLFRILRHRSDSPLRNAWIERGVAMALRTHDFSLVETLLLVLRERARKYPDIIEIAQTLAATSAQMRRVLRNVLSVDPAVGAAPAADDSLQARDRGAPT